MTSLPSAPHSPIVEEVDDDTQREQGSASKTETSSKSACPIMSTDLPEEDHSRPAQQAEVATTSSPSHQRIENAASSPPSSSSWLLTPPPFQVDQRVFCKENGKNKSETVYYQATIRKARRNTDSDNGNSSDWSFLVHYLGWNVRWDQWMPAHLILPNTPETRQLVDATNQRLQQNKQQPIAASGTTSGDSRKRRKNNDNNTSSSSTTKRANKRRDSSIKSSNNLGLYYDEYCELPLTLKTVLVDELERITRTGWDGRYYDMMEGEPSSSRDDPPVARYKKPARVVHDLPAAVPVRKLLRHFSKKTIKSIQAAAAAGTAATEGAPTEDQVKAFCTQLGELFQQALPVCLLYKEERPQYQALLEQQTQQGNNSNNKTSLLDIYGCEYLLRLYVRLPVLLQRGTNSSDGKAKAALVGPLLNELLILMQKNRQALFRGNSYREAQPHEWMEWERRVYAE